MKGLDQDHRNKILYIRNYEGSRDSEALKFRFFESLKRRRDLNSEKNLKRVKNLKGGTLKQLNFKKLEIRAHGSYDTSR